MVTSTKIHGKFDKNHSQFLAHGAAVDDHIGLLFDAYLVVPCLHMAKLGVCFCILCLFQELVGGKRMFLCFYVSRKRACGHPLRHLTFSYPVAQRLGNTILVKLELWELVIVFNNNFYSATNLCLRYASAKCGR